MTTRRALARHILLVAAVLLVVAGAASVGMYASARRDARQQAERVSAAVSDAVVAHLAVEDYSSPASFDRAATLAQLEPFLASGSLYRIKLWRIDAAQARIVLSDESRLEGETRTAGGELPAPPGDGTPVAQRVPRDAEHRFESSRSGDLLEVFIAFADAGGAPMYLEAYVPVDVRAATRHAMLVQLPLILGALATLGLATIPLTVMFARRSRREAEERAALAHAALSSSDRERQELARRLHDGPIQLLAATGMTLRARVRGDAGEEIERAAIAERAAQMVTSTVRDLRQLATELLPTGPAADDFADALRSMAQSTAPQGAQVHCRVERGAALSDDTARALYRICRELVRNAAAHSGARRIAVDVVARGDGGWQAIVADDGAGFDPDSQPAMGHIGLSLVRQLAADLGGSVEIESARGVGTRVVVGGPPRGPAPDLARGLS